MLDIPMNVKPPVSLAEMAGGSSISQPPVSPASQASPVIPQTSYSGVHLKKGQKTALISANGGILDVIKAGLSWEVSGQQYDLDVECFMLGADGRVLGDNWFVFYGSLQNLFSIFTNDKKVIL